MIYYSIITEDQQNIIYYSLEELLFFNPDIDGYYQYNELHQGIYIKIKNI